MKKKFLCMIFLLVSTQIMMSMFSFPQSQISADGLENYTYKLSQSNASYQFWTAPPSERVFKADPVPTVTGSDIKVFAAKNEFEPFQVVINPQANTSVSVNIGDFGSGITSEIYQVKYVNITQVSDNLGRLGDYPDPLWPVEKGDAVNVVSGENTSFWFTIYVPNTAAWGDYTANVTIGGINIPVTLHVFNFSISDELHVKSQMNFSFENVLEKYSVPGYDTEYWMYVDMIKQFFIDHRLTPKGVLWPGGLTENDGGSSFINYDCDGSFSDPHGIWGFEQPADKYLNGNGFNNGTGFPSSMEITFQNNYPKLDQRPSYFCGYYLGPGDWYPANNLGSDYNREWFEYMADTESYLSSLGYLDEAYYYFANEPNDQADYDAVAWYSRYVSQSAPNLTLMVSEGPHSDIYNHSDYIAGGQIDIWMPVLDEYDQTESWNREQNYGEESWVYFLYGTRPPFFNPITLDHPGIESKFTGWLMWKYRMRGLAYYSMNDWDKNPWTDPMTDGHNGDTFMFYPPDENNTEIAYGSNNHRLVPSIRFELMRDSLEDYEYLYVLNGNNRPEVNVINTPDSQVDKIITSLTSYTRSSMFMYNLRKYIGLKNGNEISEIPDIVPPLEHPRAEGDPGDYYINFQDTAGQPIISPLIVNTNEYMKIGWNEYDTNLGYGWYGDMANVMYEYLAYSTGINELQKSIIYDNWGRQKVFEFVLPNGTYDVTVSVGWDGEIYDRNYINIEGIDFINDEASNPYLVRTNEVTISDYKLTMNMGIFDEFTVLNYLDIEAVDQPPVADFTASPLFGEAPLDVSFTDTSSFEPTGWQWDFDNNGSTDSTLQNPTYQYTAPGSYTVSLTVTNSIGSDTETKVDYVSVSAPNEDPTIIIIEPDGVNDEAHTSYTITWSDSDADNNAQISLYYDTDGSGEDGILIVSGISENDALDSYPWDTSLVAEGNYYIYGVIDDGVNDAVVDYSSGTVTVNHTLPQCSQLLCNPSFEDGLDYWITKGDTDNRISLDSIDGAGSLRSEHTRTVTDVPSWAGISQVINSVEPAQTYGLSMWIKSQNAAQGHVKIKWYNSGGTVSQVDYPIININGTLGWTSFSKLVTSPADAVSAEIFIWHGINTSSQNVLGSTIWVDNIEFDVATSACGTLCNESFEQGLLYWTVSGAVGSHNIETTGAHEGVKAARSEQLYTSGDPAKWAGITQYAQVKEGTTYRFRFWLKKTSLNSAHVRIRWRNSSGSLLSTEYPITGINGTTSTWYKRESNVTAPATASKAEISIWHGVNGGVNIPGSTMWIDDITMICLALCNGGFEDGTIHWEANGKNEAEVITINVQEGAQAIKVAQSLGTSDNTQWAGVSQRTLVTGGNSYNLSFWLKKENAVQGHVKIKWRDANDQVISTQYPIGGINGTNLTWSQSSLTITAPAAAQTVEIFFWHGVNTSNQNAAGSTLYLDNITFIQI